MISGVLEQRTVMPSEMPWRQAIIQVLEEEGGPLHYETIVERISESQLRTSFGATPASTVVSLISQSLKNEASPLFERVEKGRYRLAGGSTVSTNLNKDEGADDVAGIVTAFGMYWDREKVDWKPTRPRLLGQQGENGDQVNFSDQIGVYLLYDRREIVYVGQSNENKIHSSIGVRLKRHTKNRLRSRWDRFSWFGLNPVGERTAGQPAGVGNGSSQWNTKAIIDVIEAVLIEAVEPGQNRRQGDYFGGGEYLQVEDPSVEREKIIQALRRQQS